MMDRGRADVLGVRSDGCGGGRLVDSERLAVRFTKGGGMGVVLVWGIERDGE